MNDVKRFYFDGYTFDVAKGCLDYGHQEIRLTPKAFAVLHCLLRQHGQLVSKEKLFNEVWPEVIVSDATLASSIRELRQAFNEDAKAPRYIETLHRRGYRFIARVTNNTSEQRAIPGDGCVQLIEFSDKLSDKNTAEPVSAGNTVPESQPTLQTSSMKLPVYGHPPHFRAILTVVVLTLIGSVTVLWWQPWELRLEPASVERMAFPLPSEPSIAVLPFMNLSDNPEQEYFSDGITNDIITDLSQFSTLFVVAANSTFRYKGKAVKAQQVAEDLGVRYMLEGSVQRLDNTLRINAQLTDALSGRHVWAERYDREAGNLFAIQNEIIRNIVGVIYPLADGRGFLQKGELKRIERTPTENLQAYDYFFKAMYYLDRSYTKPDNELSKQMFEKAIELDPGFGRAYGKHTWNYLFDYWNGWSDDPEAALEQALEVAKRGVAMDPNEGWVHFALASVYLFQKRHDLAIRSYEQAYALNPKDANIVVEYGWGLTYAGRPQEGIPLMQEAMRLNPYHPGYYWALLSDGYFVAGQYENAIANLEKVPHPYSTVYRRMAATYALLGRMEEARAALAKHREIEPQISLSQVAATTPFKRPEDLQRYLDGLRKAGLQ